MNGLGLWSALRSVLGSAAGRRPRITLQHLMPTDPDVDSERALLTGLDYDSGFDSQLDAHQLLSDEIERGQQTVLQQALRGLHDASTPLLTASYGAGANMHFDFRHRLVLIDPPALRRLRVMRELPQPAAGAATSDEAAVRELDVTLWDMGLAAGRLALADAPSNWWHTPLVCPSAARIERLSRVPRHLEMARRLAATPMTPSALRRQARVGVDELRRFLQACLVLQLVQWAPVLDAREAA